MNTNNTNNMSVGYQNHNGGRKSLSYYNSSGESKYSYGQNIQHQDIRNSNNSQQYMSNSGK
jgi:hypothetical protein